MKIRVWLLCVVVAGCQSSSGEGMCDPVCSCVAGAGGPTAAQQCAMKCPSVLAQASDPGRACVAQLESYGFEQCSSECPPSSGAPDARPPSPPDAGGATPTWVTMEWSFTDQCQNGETVLLRFFDDVAGEIWPADLGKAFYIDPGQTLLYPLMCRAGDKICFGGDQPRHALYWGVDIDESVPCTACCRTCAAGDVTPTSLTCN